MKKAAPISLEENRFCNFHYVECPDYKIRDIVVYSDYAVIYNEHHRKPLEKSIKNITDANKKNRKYNGYMSTATKRKITKILEAWLSSMKYHNERNRYVKKKLQRRPVFLTLTLASKQVHDDYEIKRKLLIPFIQKLTKVYDLKHYFWRAEKQRNGNIHFHLIIDCYIDKKQVQEMWNYTQDSLGYLFDYYTEKGNNNAPSTDIRKVPEQSDMVGYLIKYATKDESTEIVQGRIWGCSDSLRELKPYVDNIDNELTDVIREMRESKWFHFVEKEHVTIIYFNKNAKKDTLPERLRHRMKEYYLEIYQDLYVREIKRNDNLIIDENTEDICVEDFEEIWHQSKINYDIFL